MRRREGGREETGEGGRGTLIFISIYHVYSNVGETVHVE